MCQTIKYIVDIRNNQTRVADCYSSLILTLATHQEIDENTHQEKNKIWSSRKKQDPTWKS